MLTGLLCVCLLFPPFLVFFLLSWIADSVPWAIEVIFRKLFESIAGEKIKFAQQYNNWRALYSTETENKQITVHVACVLRPFICKSISLDLGGWVFRVVRKRAFCHCFAWSSGIVLARSRYTPYRVSKYICLLLLL